MRNRLAVVSILAGLMLTFTLSGCASDAQFDQSGSKLDSLLGTWTLVSIEGENIDKILREELQHPDLAIKEDGRVSGFSGVNSFNGQLDLDAVKRGGFSSGPFASTRMAGPPEAMDLEQRVLSMLGQAYHFTVKGDELDLLSGTEVLLVYTRVR